jgi:hypothetical protein
MKLVPISAVPVFLLFGSIAPAYAQANQDSPKQDTSEKQRGGSRQQQDQQRQQGQRAQQPPQQQDQQRQQGQRAQQPPQQQDQQRQQGQRAQQPPQQQDQQRQQGLRAQQQPQRTEQQARVWQQQSGWRQQGGWQEHATWQQDRARQWQDEHRSWAQRGGYGGYYIPEDRFSLYFGSQHWFHITNRPIIVMGYPRFQYGGFSFMLVDPWPEYWPEDWYSRDDVYVDYNNGYYLYNRRDPSVALAISVVL